MRFDLSITPAGLAARTPLGPVAPPPPPPFAVRRIVIEGDSITSGSPSTPNGFYGYQYHDSRADLFVVVRGQGSRVVGYPPGFARDDDSNSLIGNVAEDMAYAPDLLTMMIGANDLANARTAAQHRGDLIAYCTAVKAARPGCRVAWSPPTPYNASGAPHPNLANYSAQRAALLSTCREPAVWSQWADYFVPMGLHPDFADPAVLAAKYGDAVHPNAAGHAALFTAYKAAIDTIADATRATSTRAYDAVWPVAESNLAPASEIVRRFVVAGVAHAGLGSGIAVSGGGAQVRLNGGSWEGAIGRIYNGDVIDLKLTTSAVNSASITIDLTIGSETRAIAYATVAAVAPVDYVHGGTVTQVAPVTAHDFNALGFSAGKPVVVLTSYSSAGGSIDSGPTSVTLTPTGGGAAIALTRRLEAMRGTSASRVAELWTAGVEVPAGNYDLDIVRPAAAAHNAIAWGVLRNAEAVPVSAAANTPAEPSQSNHATSPATVPAHGLALAFYLIEDDTTPEPVTVTGPSVEVAEVVAIGTAGVGLCLARRASSGPVEFVHRPGTAARGIVVFKAAGT